MENEVTWCVRSTMRRSGATEYITPLHRATESSITPKSVMKTTVGWGLGGASSAQVVAGGRTSRNPAARTAKAWRRIDEAFPVTMRRNPLRIRLSITGETRPAVGRKAVDGQFHF